MIRGVDKWTTSLCLLLVLACALFASGCLSIPGRDDRVEGVGTITYIDIEGGFFGIITSDGTHYYPLNLEKKYEVDGIRVRFSGDVREDIVTVAQWGMPLELESVQLLNDSTEPMIVAVTMDESRTIAEAYVLNMTEFRDYEGRNLTLSETIVLRCPYCWHFVYEFDMRSMKDPAVVDHATIQITVQEGNVISVFSSSGSKEKPPEQEAQSVADILANPVYGTPVAVYGKVSLLGELFCPCFIISSGGESLEVWYDLMIDQNGTVQPPVDVTGINNGDKIVIIGILNSEGGQQKKDVFYASDIRI